MEKFKSSAKAQQSETENYGKKKIYFTSKNGRVWETNMADELIVDRTVNKSTTHTADQKMDD